MSLIVADVFGECYSNSEDRAYALLVRRTHCWSKSTVLNLATEADAKSFFAHDGVQVTASGACVLAKLTQLHAKK